MDSMAEERLLSFLKLKLTEEQANKFSFAERKFLLDKAFDDIDALKGATLAQLEEPPGDQGCIWSLSNPMSNPMSNIRWSRRPACRDGQHAAGGLWPWCEQNRWLM